MENIKLRQLAIEFFENHLNPTEDDLYDFLVNNEWKIYCDYDKNTHREKIIGELEYSDYAVDKIPEMLIDGLVERFEDIYYDDENSGHYDNCIRYAIDDYEEDLEEYKLEEK